MQEENEALLAAAQSLPGVNELLAIYTQVQPLIGFSIANETTVTFFATGGNPVAEPPRLVPA